MRGREGKGPPATDLLVCFPSRAHLSLMPKPICSPARPSDSSTLRHHRRPSHLRKSSNRGGAASPLPWSRSKHDSADASEPTSPKVTCAGQIKVRTKPNSCKNWQSVMEEIERMHKKNKKRSGWIEALGFKKEVMQFLTCLRNVRFDFRCFGVVPSSEITSDEDEDEEEDEDVSSLRESKDEDEGEDQGSRAVFSKWFMILQEDNVSKEVISPYGGEPPSAAAEVAAPPPNALLLMRCRSAPAKSWLEEREEEERKKGEIEKEEKGKRRDLSCEIGEIDEVMEEIQEKILRCRSWKR